MSNRAYLEMVGELRRKMAVANPARYVYTPEEERGILSRIAGFGYTEDYGAAFENGYATWTSGVRNGVNDMVLTPLGKERLLELDGSRGTNPFSDPRLPQKARAWMVRESRCYYCGSVDFAAWTKCRGCGGPRRNPDPLESREAQ